ncbi:MAE_28990/MAE_18760 family HEPN-like nuclease [Yersinia similis]|uniref:MAE_28990/MAE_18760 family HEPN-like nuclease n=1 Tax=Yersinia similis TaxID=367190 RepID=UPI0005DDD97F|nr:MAE_28990/MAE_18760 family HEPN-like nuclease [Yersinia similis]CNB09465.1 Uncharacterised protein [Yersinia similis]CNF44764.1 Uncharacterised protein [Yersinia similis]
MNAENFLEQLELEKLWREDEIRSMHNILSELQSEQDKNKIRRAIICLLYAHIEGFVKFSFSLYVDGINRMKLKCEQVKPILAAAVYHVDFMRLTNPDAKSRVFNKKSQSDSHIQRLCLHEEFFDKISDFFHAEIKIKDSYINTENNIGREVLEKLLYQVGLSHKALDSIIGPLSRLKNKRNGIAHGADKNTIEESEYQIFYGLTLGIMGELSRVLFLAFQSKDFLKKAG